MPLQGEAADVLAELGNAQAILLEPIGEKISWKRGSARLSGQST